MFKGNQSIRQHFIQVFKQGWKYLPILVSGGVFLTSLLLWRALEQQEAEQIRQTTQQVAISLTTELSHRMRERLLSLLRDVKGWEKGGRPPQSLWETNMKLYLEHYPEFTSIEWIDAENKAPWIVTQNGYDRAIARNFSTKFHREFTLKNITDQESITLSRSINPREPSQGLFVYMPVFPQGEFDGFLVGVFQTEELFEHLLPRKLFKGYNIRLLEGEEEVYRFPPQQSSSVRGIRSQRISLYGVDWRIQVIPTPQLLIDSSSRLPEVVLGSGILMALLMGLTIHQIKKSHQRAKQLETVNQGLAQEIADRKSAELAKQERESILTSFYNSGATMMGIVEIFHDDLIHISDNIATAHFLGLNAEKMPNKLASELGMSLENRLLWIQYLQASQQQEKPVRFEYADTRTIPKRWLAVTVCPIPPLPNRPQQYSYIAEDISDRKVAEAQLQQTTQLQQAILDHANYSIILTDQQGIIRLFNKSAEQLLGYLADEVIGKSTPLIFHDLDEIHQRSDHLKQSSWNRVNSEFEIIIAKAKYHEVDEQEWTYIRADGSRFPVLLSVTTLYNHYEEITGYLLIGSDITKRKQAELKLRESEEKYRSVINHVTEVIFQMDLQGNWIFLNPAWQTIMGFTVTESLGKPWLEYVFGEDRKLNYDQIQALIQEQENHCRYQSRYLTATGKICWLEVYGQLTFDERHRKIGISGTLTDISDRKAAEIALQQANQKLTSWVAELETHNREIALLSQMTEILQACRTIGEAYRILSTLIEPLFPGMSGAVFEISASRQLVEAIAYWGSNLTSKKLFTPDECWALRRGREHYVESKKLNLRCHHTREEAGHTLCLPMMAQGETIGILYLSTPSSEAFSENQQRLAITVAEHISISLANLNLREKLQKLSIRDPLTGLYNRRYLEESLAREIHRAERKQLSIGAIVLDVDHFKQFNDTFGHEAGDQVLQELGNFLQQQIRGSDIACRYGGEELVLILPETNLENTLQRAEQIREGIKELVVRHQNKLLGTITASIGVACYPEHSLTGETLIAAADAALYRAKKAGRDRVCSA